MFKFIDMEKVMAMPYYYDVLSPIVVICMGMLLFGTSYNLMRLFHNLIPTIAFAFEQLVKVIVQITKPKPVRRGTQHERMD